MANTNVNVVQQIKFLLETELDEKSKIQVGKDLKSVLEDAVIAFDKSETEKNLKPIVAMINSVLKKADMPIIDEGSITASFEKIANMSADTFQEAFNAAIKNNGGIRLSFNDMKLDDIIESINKVSESIEQLGHNTSNVKKSIEKDIRDINAAIERMGNGENADKSIQDALQYKPKTVKSYNKTGSQSIDELYNEYDSATNWEEKTVALVKYKKEYDSYLEYLKKKKPTEVESFSSGKYGKLYKRIGNDFSSMVGNLENILVVKRQRETGVLDDRQNELVDDRNRPWAREKTLQEVNRTLKGGLKVSSDGGGGDGGKPVEEHLKSELSKREDAVNKSAKNNNNTKNGSKVVVEEPKIGKKYTMLRAVEFTDDGREQKKQAVDTYGAEYWSRGIDTVKSYADDHRNQSYIIKGNIIPKNPLIIDANGFMWNDWENIPQFKELFPGLRELLADRNNIDDDKQKYINEQARAAGFDAVILKNVQDNKNADLDTRAPTTDTIAVLDDSIVKVTGSIRELTETSEILKSKYGQSMLSDIQRYKELIQKGEDISDEEDEEVGALIEKLTANLTKHVYSEQRKYFEKFEDDEISAEDLAEYLISNRDSKKSSKVFEDKPSKTIPDFYEKPHESTTEEHLSLLKQQQEASQKWYQETITRLEKKPENESLVKQLREDKETSAQNFKKLIEFYESQKAETEQTTKSEAGSTKPNENKKQPKIQESTKQKQSAEQTDIVIDAETLHTAISGVTDDLAKEQTLGEIKGLLEGLAPKVGDDTSPEQSGGKLNEQNKDTVAIDEASLKTVLEGVTYNVKVVDDADGDADQTSLTTAIESATSDLAKDQTINNAKDVMYDAQTVIHNAYNKQKNGQTEDSTVANNQKKIKSYKELVAIVNRYFELKSKLRDINVEYNDGIDGENYNPPIFTAMESIESMLENAQLDTSNMDVFNALHEDGANAESAVKRIAAAIGIEVEQQERLNESIRDGIQVRKSLNQTEEQSLLPDSNKFNEKSFLDDAQKAEVVKLGEEYRVILSLLEKDDEKVSEVADALRERAKAIMNVMYAVRQNDSTPSETYKLLFGGSDAAARAISDSKKQSELVSDFDTKNIDNQSRQVAIDLIYKEVEAEKRLLAEKKSQEEAEKETYKTEFIAQYTKALEKEKSLINDIIELQKELNILEDSNDESKYSDVLRKWSDKRAELQDANDALYSAFVDVKPSDAKRYIKELQSANAPALKSLITTDAQSNSEENDMNVLLASVNAVTEAVKLKTRAFNTERSAVQLVVEDEVKALDVLENKLISIKQTLEGLMNNVGAGASDLASGLSNVNINVNYPENSKVEFNSTAIEQLVSAINSIPSKQNPVTTTAVGNVPATENTLLIIKAAVAAINNKMGKGTKSGGGGYKKTTKSDYTGSPFFGEKIKTRELELGKFVQQLNNAGKNTQKLQDMIRQLQTALQAVNSGESLSVYDQMFRQVKLLVSIDDLQRAPVEKDKISDYKQLIKFAKEYYKLVEKYEKAEDGSNRKRVLGNQKDAIEKFMSDNGIDLGNIALDDDNYNKQLSDLRIKHSNNMAEIDAANKDKSNKKAMQEEQAEVKKLIDLYRALGEEVAKRDYAETKESKDAHQQTINEIAKKIRGNAYYDKVNKQDAISVMQDAIANKSVSLRQSQADKAGAQRVRDENKALKEQEQTITKLESMYKNLGKAMAEIEVNGDLKKKEEASQLQKEIDIKIQGLQLEKDEEDTLREKLNIIKETAKENNKALLVAQNKQKDNKKELNKQVRTSRQKARIGRANSTINGAEDAIYNAMVIDSVDASEVAVVQTLNTELEKLKVLYAAIQATDGAVSERDAIQIVNQTRLVKAHATELNKLLQQYERLSGDNVKEIVSYDAKGNLEKQLINAAKAATNGRAEIKGFNEETGELVAIVKGEKNSFTECTYAVREYDNQIVQVTGTTKKMEGFMDGILRKMKEIFMYFSGSSVVYKLFNELRQGIQYVREIDLALTELKKVTDETDETYERFLNTASKTGEKIGSTISNYTRATAIFAKLGYDINMSSEMAEAAIIYQNVGDGIESADAAAESIISTMKGFGLQASDAMSIVDKFNQVGNEFSITSKGIGDALQRSASALAEGNNTLDESIGLITAANSVVQDPESVGTALKTLTLRLRGAKTELEDAGLETDNMVESTSTLQKKLLALTGGKVDIMLDANTFKSSTEILREMSAEWENMTDIQRAE